MSALAVENQIFIALITYCLLMLLKQETGCQDSLLKIQRLLLTCLYEPFIFFVQKLYRKGKHSSKGRQKIDHEARYQITLCMTKAGMKSV